MGEIKSKMQRLLDGETFITSERGNSMEPLIKSGQNHKLAPATVDDVEIGDIVYCKVYNSFLTHLVKQKGKRGCLIGSNKGSTNGWTKKIYGKVVEVL